jgi:hypothetical protein
MGQLSTFELLRQHPLSFYSSIFTTFASMLFSSEVSKVLRSYLSSTILDKYIKNRKTKQMKRSVLLAYVDFQSSTSSIDDTKDQTSCISIMHRHLWWSYIIYYYFPIQFLKRQFLPPKKEKVENLISRSEKRTTQKKGTITLDSKY